MALAATTLAACGRSEAVAAFGDETGGTETFGTETTPTGPTNPTVSETQTQTQTETETETETDPTGDDCQIDADCPIFDPCEMGQCIDGFCEYRILDLDEDGFSPFMCGGEDCNDFNPQTFPGAPENCFDGDDNDCNGVADCFDPVCENVPDCGCQPAPGGEDCENGVDDDCDTTTDCLDVDCQGTPICGCADDEVGLCGNGFDDDCDSLFDCDDPDCATAETCSCASDFEICGNGIDDDCNDLIDCADDACANQFPCTCMGPPQPENCSNGEDDDCDELVDCADPDCVISQACEDCVPEVCNNNQDDDCDGKIDCADDNCAFDPICAATPEQCNNGLDDDNDGDIDCDDSDCVNVPVCVEQQSTCETALKILGSGQYIGDTTGNTPNAKGSCGGDAGEAVFEMILSQPSRVELDSIGTSFDSVIHVRKGSCENGQEIGCDDDSGGFQWSARLEFTILYPGTYYVFLDGFTIDPFGGANEGPFILNVEIEENPAEQCTDGIDNDGDVYVDCGDADCVNHAACFQCQAGSPPTAEFGVGACTDGIDNDCDGDIDCDDEDCSASPENITECCTGTDQNGNNIPDDFNCRCNNDSECSGGQICYSNSVNACGIPCTNFFGDVCPFLLPGSVCNSVTDQCEF